jgi:hypothetical protein
VIIKKKQKDKKKFSNLFLKFYFYLTSLLAIIFISIFLNTGLWNNIKIPLIDKFYSSSINYYLNIFDIAFKAIKGNFVKLPDLNIDISFNNVVKVEEDRKRVNNISGKAGGTSYDFKNVNIKIVNGNKKHKAKLRIKGDRKIHFEDKKNSSYKIELKNNTIFGLRKFSIMKPRARNYIHEWLFHQLLAEGKLITLKYDFLNLKINGKNEGLYVLEEGFDKILIERNSRRNGPIFSLYESFSTDIEDAKLEVYNKKTWMNKDNIKLTKIAATKLKLFFDNEDKSEAFMDLDKWAWFLAVADINSYNHALAAKSVKFYYNPISGIFEPIGFDGHRTIPNYNKNYINWEKRLNRYVPSSYDVANRCKESFTGLGKNKCNKLIYNLFYNSQGNLNNLFYNKYRNSILKITSNSFLDNFFNKRSNDIEKINAKIFSDYFFVDHIFNYGPGFYFFNKEDFYIKSKILLESIKSEPEKVFIQQDNQKIQLVNKSINNNNLILEKLRCNNIDDLTSIFNISLQIEMAMVLSNIIDLKKISNTGKLYCDEIQLRNTSNNLIYLKKIDTLNVRTSVQSDGNILARYTKYFKKDSDILTLIKNTTFINENIFIPSEYLIKIKSGDEIILTDNAFIFSNSPWHVNGLTNEINIKGLSNNFGGGIIIKNTKKKSIFNNVKFSYLTGLKNYSFNLNKSEYLFTKTTYDNSKLNTYNEVIVKKLTKDIIENQKFRVFGAINFLQTDVEMNKVFFEKINSEDALNIINSNFTLENIFFSENASDAIDVDFGIGSIVDASFNNIKNDALDFSGSIVTLDNLKMDTIGDKMISAGEKSILTVTNLIGNKSKIAIASKDGSLTTLDNININNTDIGLAAYKKKSEYTGSSIIAKNIIITNSDLSFLVDDFSKIILNDKIIRNDNIDIKNIKNNL